MQVFKVYFKVIRNNRGQLIMYATIFLAVTLLVSAFYASPAPPAEDSFSAAKPNVAIINEDRDSPLVDGFLQYLWEHATLSMMDTGEEALRDALFFHAVEYGIKIPEGFAKALMQGEDPVLEAAGTTNSTNAVFLKALTDRYFATAALYVKHGGEQDEAAVAGLVKRDLSQAAGVELAAGAPVEMSEMGISMHLLVFNYMAYSLFAVLILGVTTFMLAFNQPDVRRRNFCGPLPTHSMNLQMFLANMVFGLVCWALFSGLGIALYPKEMLSAKGLWLCLNAFMFMLACLGISFLLGTLIKKRAAQAPLQNTLTLACSFLGGAFVPQFLLGKTVITIASFTPTYWYIKSNHIIAEIGEFSFAALGPVLTNMLIVLGFGIAALLLAMAISKKRAAGSFA